MKDTERRNAAKEDRREAPPATPTDKDVAREKFNRRQAGKTPGYLCRNCGQVWPKDSDRSLRGGDPSCPYCGARGMVTKWRIR